MSRDLPAALTSALSSSEVELFYAVDLFFKTQTLRFWSGLGELVYNSETYTGSANLLAISQIDETSDVSAKGATLTLSGIPSDLLSLVLSEPYQGRKCNIYLGVRDSASTAIADVMAQVFSGYMDQMSVDEGAETATISLAVESRLIDLERPRARRYTDENQKSRFPNDLGFQYVNDLQNKKFAWGR